MTDSQPVITKEMLVRYYQLNEQKKRTEEQLDELKNIFNHYFDLFLGYHEKGEVTVDEYMLQRQIRTIEKYEQEETVKRLETLQLNELIQRRPDNKKIKSALDLGILSETDLDGCKQVNKLNVIIVKPVEHVKSTFTK
ncbi:hypothetical protein J14TS2_43400 [Bacillus sp. J14TS2]|uniref:hypothetical protein n=1 Tax=Bacillus sp. J14TS2 TaxID=2807188 RepID=UPI001B2F4973|nr:hypothetical protein [Bacillus sp. J14TS2]GIN73865.1 hypothetical protein J14TS2_43400 [Bacillus sp. J14TS2]